MNLKVSFVFLATSLCLISCSNNDVKKTVGNTTEIENAIAVRLFEDGKPAANVAYKILPSWFVPDTLEAVSEDDYAYTGTTDSLGWMRIENHLEGSYTVEFENENNSAIASYTLNNLTPFVNIDSVSLVKRGAIKGWVSIPQNEDHAWIYIQGLSRIEKTDSKGSFTMGALPSGEVKLKAWSPNVKEIIGHAIVNIPQGDTVDIGHVDAPDEIIIKKTQRINPRSLISSWMRPMAEPYVLVLRLDSTFNFAETADDGSDIHLYNANGEQLPIEIDSWDKGIQSGTINVRLENLADTVAMWTLEWGDIYDPAREPVDVWKGLSDSLVLALNSVKILDFEDSNLFMNNLPEPLTKRDWYIQAHEGATLLDSVGKNISKAIEESNDSTFGKNVLHVKYEATSPEYIVIGTRITEIPQDLSRLDSVEVWVKGDGKFEIILETIVESDTNYKATYLGKADSVWTRIAVRPQDFETENIKSYHGWDVTRNRITRFTMFAYDGNEIWVDNVRMYGVNRDDLN